MKNNLYRVVVEHDKGKVIILVGATGIFAAREIIKKAEGCPDSAILAVSLVRKSDYKNKK